MVRRDKEEAAKEQLSTADLAYKLQQANIDTFKERSGFPLNQAQRNLEGKTYYVDDATLKAFVAKIHSVHVMDDGLLLGMVESIQAGPNPDSGRVYRPVFFDVFGNTVHRPSIEESFKTQKAAQAEFWKVADELDAYSLTIEGIEKKQAKLDKEMQDFKKLLREVE